MDEMDVETVDFGGVVVEAVQRFFACAPVVVVGPVVGQFAGVGQRDALGPVVDAFGVGPAGAGQPGPQVVEIGVGYRDAKRSDLAHGPILNLLRAETAVRSRISADSRSVRSFDATMRR